MNHKFFKISVNDPTASEAELNAFCVQHRIAAVEKKFVEDGANSCWAICVTWLESDGPLVGSTKRKTKVDYKEVLSDDDFTIYAQLRELRKSIADKEGTPAYNVFTNEQLAQIVQQRVTTKTALSALEGVGKTRVQKYGDEFLTILQTINWPDTPNETDENSA